MRKQKIELTDDQKNIAKRFLLCNNPTCVKDDGEAAVATKLCPFCYRVGYCCTQCLTKDLTRHCENECKKNINSQSIKKTNNDSFNGHINNDNGEKNKKNETSKKPNKNGILKMNPVNINDYLSETDSSDDQYCKKKSKNSKKNKSK